MLELKKSWFTNNFQNFVIELSDAKIVFARPLEEGDEKAKNFLNKLISLNINSNKDIPHQLYIKMLSEGVNIYPM